MASGKLFERLLGAAKQVAAPALTSGGLTGGLALLTGSSVPNALAYGLADTAASGGSLALLRKLRPGSYRTQTLRDVNTGETKTTTSTSKLEVPLNIAASIGTGTLLSGVLEGVNPQSTQIAQQIEQRSLLNNFPIEQQLSTLSPGTQSQLSGTQFEQVLNQVPRNQWMNYLSPEDQEAIYGVMNPRLI
jgi:hypothetical protein